ncbi:MAG: glycosyltransferase family 2 protein [Xanthobacteraceae bacterium]|nr:glycosyltransferase family 2 protein [Xanthobacteraceae bacterium]
MADLISVIVSTYNRADALDAVLRSLSTQSDRNFEIIVADDGSRPDTGEVVARWRTRAGIPLKHVWHEDRGFRLAEIRNRAILVSQGAYCIFRDGDCLARPGFIAAHRAVAQPGWFVTGSRLLLSQALTAHVLASGLAPEQWSFGRWIGQRLRGGVNRIGPLLLPWSGVSAKRNAQRWRGARGSNMGFWRADLDAVDGFDAAFVGWGREDSDMFARMIRHGIRRRNARLDATVLHLWHPEQDRSRLDENQRQLDQLLNETRVRARQGLSALQASSECAAREVVLP